MGTQKQRGKGLKMKKIRILILLAGCFMAFMAVRSFFLSGVTNNAFFAVGISFGLLLYGWFFERLIKVKWLNILICSFAAFFIGLMVFIAAYGIHDTVTYKEEAVILLGGGVKEETVSQALKRRLDAAAEYHKKNPAALIIVTGGLGKRAYITEALAMERYLVEKGVPIDKIIREDEALSTWENIKYSKIILDGLLGDGYTAAVITNEFHIYRGASFTRAAGIDCTHLHSRTPWYTIPASYTREAAAVVKMWIFKI